MQTRDVSQIEDQVDELDKKRDFLQAGVRRPSAYVEVFESVFSFCVLSVVLTISVSLATVRTVLEHEHHLLSDKELEVLERFGRLCCKISLQMNGYLFP